jgi:endonuclease/exonuclease/phosphatase family metal-dependent hydrolase
MGIRVRICTWNIQFGLRLPAVLEALRTVADFDGVDVLALQEASQHGGRCDAELIAEALGPGYGHFQASAQVRGGRVQANALVWRHDAFNPAAAPSVLWLPGPREVQAKRVERTLLRALPAQARMAVCAESDNLRVYVVHLDVIGFAHKLEQFRAVIAHMAAQPAVPLTLIAGDLNTFGPARPRLWRRIAASAAEAGLINVTAAIRRTHWTGQKLDAIYALAAGPIKSRAWTVKVRASDHLPVFAEISR